MSKNLKLQFEALDPDNNPSYKRLRKQTFVYVSKEDFPTDKYPTLNNLDCKIKIDGKVHKLGVILSENVKRGKIVGSYKLIERLCGLKDPKEILVEKTHDVEVFYSPLNLKDMKFKELDLSKEEYKKYGDDINCLYVSGKDVCKKVFDNPDNLYAIFKVDNVESKVKVKISNYVSSGEVRGSIVLAESICGSKYNIEKNFFDKKHNIKIRDFDSSKVLKIDSIEVTISLDLDNYKHGTMFNVIENNKDKNDIKNNVETDDYNKKKLVDFNLIALDPTEINKKVLNALKCKPVENGTRFIITISNTVFSNIPDKELNLDCEVIYGSVTKNAQLMTVDDKTIIDSRLGKGVISAIFELEKSNKLQNLKPLINQIKYDWSDFGVGGLNKQINMLISRLFVNHMLSNAERKKYNVQPVKGMLLYGPPGNGKTLLFKSIAKVLGNALRNSKSKRKVIIKTVNGPELESKWLGGSAENVRNLFKSIKDDYNKNGDNSNYYLILFDEVDSLFQKREGKKHIGAINQLLAELDGTKTPPNFTIAIATNLKKLLDDALLRPGRIDLIIPFTKPDLNARKSILSVYVNSTKNMFADDIDLNEIAYMTKGFSGAEIKSLIDKARSNAIMNNFSKDEKTNTIFRKGNLDLVKIKKSDIDKALSEVSEQHNSENLKFSVLAKRPFAWYDKKMVKFFDKVKNNIKALNKTKLFRFGVFGEESSGKTALAVAMANKLQKQGYDITMISAADYSLKSDELTFSSIQAKFDEAINNGKSVVLIDDIEKLIETRSHPRKLINYLSDRMKGKTTIPKGKELVIIATGDPEKYAKYFHKSCLRSMKFDVGMISKVEHLEKIFKAYGYIVKNKLFNSIVSPKSVDEWVDLASTFLEGKDTKELDFNQFVKSLEKDFVPEKKKNTITDRLYM